MGSCLVEGVGANGCVSYTYTCPSLPIIGQLNVWIIRALDGCVKDTGPSLTFNCQPSGDPTFIDAAIQTIVSGWFCFQPMDPIVEAALMTLGLICT